MGCPIAPHTGQNPISAFRLEVAGVQFQEHVVVVPHVINADDRLRQIGRDHGFDAVPRGNPAAIVLAARAPQVDAALPRMQIFEERQHV